MELHLGSKAYEIAMNKLREQGCTCEPSKIEVSRNSGSGVPWTGEEDPELLSELSEGFLRPAIVDHQDDCALSDLIDPLDRRSSHDQAEALLLEATPSLATGVTVSPSPTLPMSLIWTGSSRATSRSTIRATTARRSWRAGRTTLQSASAITGRAGR